jgi:hypothetical protein
MEERNESCSCYYSPSIRLEGVRKTTKSLDSACSLDCFWGLKVTHLTAVVDGLLLQLVICLAPGQRLLTLWEVFLTYNGATDFWQSKDCALSFCCIHQLASLSFSSTLLAVFNLTRLLWQLENVPRTYLPDAWRERNTTYISCEVPYTYVCKFFEPVTVHINVVWTKHLLEQLEIL